MGLVHSEAASLLPPLGHLTLCPSLSPPDPALPPALTSRSFTGQAFQRKALSPSRDKSHPSLSTVHRPADRTGDRVGTLEHPRAWLRPWGAVRAGDIRSVGQTLLGISPLLRPLTGALQAPLAGMLHLGGGLPCRNRGDPSTALPTALPRSLHQRAQGPPSGPTEQALRGGLIPTPPRSSAQHPAPCSPEKTLTLAVEAAVTVWLPQPDSPPRVEREGGGGGEGTQQRPAGRAQRFMRPREQYAPASDPRAPGASPVCTRPSGVEAACPSSELTVTLTGRW